MRRIRIEEMRHQRGGSGRVQVRGLVGDDPRVQPGHVPGSQRIHGRRQRAQLPGLADERPGGPRTDGQDTGDLLHDGHLSKNPVLQGSSGRGHGLLQFEGLGGIPGLDRCDLRLQPGNEAHPFQPDLVLPFQHINPGAPVNDGGRLHTFFFKEQRVDGSHSGKNTLQWCCYHCAVSHI
jgi:hypothetical protein